MGLMFKVPHLQLSVETIELGHGALVIMERIHLAVLQHLQLPAQLLDFRHRYNKLALLLLEEIVHLLDLLHCKNKNDTFEKSLLGLEVRHNKTITFWNNRVTPNAYPVFRC